MAIVTERPGPDATQDEWITFAKQQDAEAQAAPCDYKGCDGSDHDPNALPAEWSHTVVNETFGNGIDGLIVATPGVGYHGYIDFSNRGDDEWSSAEFREAADKYEAFPSWLRSMADRIDALNSK